MATTIAAVPIAGVHDEPAVIITEVQMTGPSAAQEFIELYNTTDTNIDFGDTTDDGGQSWKLHFFSSTQVAEGKPVWTQPATTVTLSGSIEAHGYYLIASNDYSPADIEADQHFSARLASTGGGLQLIDTLGSVTMVHDRVMWTSQAAAPEGVNPTPPNNGSMQRLPNEDDEYVDIGGALTSFMSGDRITPRDIWVEPVVEELEPDSEPESEAGVGTEAPVAEAVNEGLDAVRISELMPNPGAPETDELDEFIELFNPNDQEFFLKGYAVQVGTSTLKTFTISADVAIPAGGHLALYSESTRLVLTNTGGQARLLDPAGEVIHEAASYGTAKENVAWAEIGGSWSWTYQPTPGLPNVQMSSASAAAPGTAAAKKSTAKASSAKVKGATTTKAKTKKAKAAKVKKQKQPKVAVANAASISEGEQKAFVHTGVLVAVAGLAVLYGAYEYRHDIANRIAQLRGNRTVRG